MEAFPYVKIKSFIALEPLIAFDKIIVPKQGAVIKVDPDFTLDVPNNPIIPFIAGDGVGIDITPAMIDVVDAAVYKAYDSERKIAWVLALHVT